MKVIVAGYPKTGTKSMNAALTRLGYKVYDFPENCFMLFDEYKRIINDGWTSSDFRRMYKDADAVVDYPAFYFWEEIHKAFPDAKIILTTRDDEDVWFKSWKTQVEKASNAFMVRLMEWLSPTNRRILREYHRPLSAAIFGVLPQPLLRRNIRWNEALNKLKYRSHNAYVRSAAPADKLLVFQCSEGWGPLCNFLGVPVPDEPFPRENVGSVIMDKFLKTDPIFLRMQREAMASLAIIVIFIACVLYFILRLF